MFLKQGRVGGGTRRTYFMVCTTRSVDWGGLGEKIVPLLTQRKKLKVTRRMHIKIGLFLRLVVLKKLKRARSYIHINRQEE